MIDSTNSVVVLARGSLADDSAHLAVRVALALPLGGAQVILALADTATAIAVPEVDPGGRGRQLSRELDALTSDEEVPIWVERESLQRLGLVDRTLRPGVVVVSRGELEQLCLRARSCLVI
jgi:hypothetical protein